MQWFEAQMIDTVPPGFAGMGRKVYPGFVQLSAFMSMNLDRHLRAHAELFAALVHGDTAKAEQTKTFYDEYFAVLDLAAEFYLETVQWVFKDYRLAKGERSEENTSELQSLMRISYAAFCLKKK